MVGFFNRKEQVAEDLLQETFLRIHKELNNLDDKERITAWVFQIARNLVIDYYRTKARTNTPGIGDWEAVANIDKDRSLNELIAGWLPEMIARLPSVSRQAVELYELEGMPQREIADRLDISLSGAKSRIQRGRQQLKTMIFNCCSFEQDRRGNIIDCVHHEQTECDPSKR